MLPDLTVLLALLLGLSSLFGAPADPVLSVLGTCAAVALGLLMARATAARGLVAIVERQDGALGEASLRWITTWALLGWLGCLFTFQWGAWVHTAIPRTFWLTRVAVLLLPALALWGGAWWLRAPLEAALARMRGASRPPATGWPAVVRGLRRNAIAFMPLFVIMGVTEAIWVLGALGVEPLAVAAQWLDNMELLSIAVVMGIVLLSLPLVPWLMARMLRARPLPEGRLRSVLERAAATLGLKYREMLLWPTGGRVYNAMVVGVTGGSRRIFFTDALLNTLSEDETLAVFFHEAGHARRHHLEMYLLLFFSMSLLLHAATAPLQALGIPPFLLLIVHLALIWFVLLGSVSRRFEREADVFGARHADFLDPTAEPVAHAGLPALLPRGTALMMSALERLRQVVGHMPSHRHGPVESRIAFLASLATNPETERRWTRELRLLRGAIALTVAAALAATAWILPGEVAQARSEMAMESGGRAYERAFALEHPASHPTSDHPLPTPASRALWEQAHEHFTAAAAAFSESTSEAARRRRLLALANAADTSLHGLRDSQAAAREFREVLTLARSLDRDDPFAASLRFQAHIELGRMAAWRLASTEGDPLQAVQEAQQHLEAADDLRTSVLEQIEAFDTDRLSWFRERANLLRFTLKARVAARDPGADSELRVARRWLEELTQGSHPADHWVELRDDARLELR